MVVDTVHMYLVHMLLSTGLGTAKATMYTYRKDAMSKDMAKRMARMAKGKVGSKLPILVASRMHSPMPKVLRILPMVGQMQGLRDPATHGSEGSGAGKVPMEPKEEARPVASRLPRVPMQLQ